MSWERAFVVATLTVGDSFDDALASMDATSRARIEGVVAAVRTKSRADRARWMATILAEAAAEIDRMGIA